MRLAQLTTPDDVLQVGFIATCMLSCECEFAASTKISLFLHAVSNHVMRNFKSTGTY
jgi:hypothetical protein